MAQAVNVMDIVDSRSQEITAAMEALKTNMSVSYKLSIPFYMRRRAASHNPKRLPARVRPPDAAPSKVKFKWKKRAGKIQRDENSSKEKEVDKEDSTDKKTEVKEYVMKARRLETHLWHAKRCHMKDMWGYRLALCTTQKGARAAHRATNTATTLQDTSYYHWVCISGDTLHRKLDGVLLPNHVTLHRVTCSHLYQAEECLGPVRVYWTSEETVLLRLHPAIIYSCSNISDLFPGLSVKSLCDAFSQFTLHGVRSLELLVKSLTLSDTTNSVVKDVWDKLSDDAFYYDIMSGTVLGCEVVIPPREHKVFVSVLDTEITQPRHRLCSDETLGGDFLFKSTLSSTSPVTSTITSNKDRETLPCCIYKDPVTGALTLMLPRGTGTRLWISLVYSGGRVVGLQDEHSLNTDRSRLTFPVDYPDTAAGRRYWEEDGREREEKEIRRPPQKRVKYAELGITSPFVPDWAGVCGSDDISVIRDPASLRTLPAYLDQHLVTVSISCFKRGNFRPGSHVYYFEGSCDETTSSDPVYSSEDRYPVVGYLTSGNYCLNSGKGGGIALILAGVFKKVRKECGALLVRNTTSKQYRFVNVNLIL